MGRKLLILLVLLSLIFWNNSNVFGYNECLFDGKDYTLEYDYHICGKSGLGFCLFPRSDNTLALH